MQITNTRQPAVVPVDFNASPAWPTSGIYPNGDIPWKDTSALAITGTAWDNGWDFASPKMQSTTLNNTVTSPQFSTVQYQGTPFVIDSSDAPLVMQFLPSGDTYTSASYLSHFTSTTDPVSALTSCPNGGTTPSAHSHPHSIPHVQAPITLPIFRQV